MLEKLRDDAEGAFLSRWLNNELTPEELAEFEAHPEYKEYKKIIAETDALRIKAYDVDKALQTVKSNNEGTLKQKERKVIPLLATLSVAASIAILVGLFIFNTSKISHDTGFGEQKVVTLPDGSEMILNAKSSAKYDKDWSDNRLVNLDGEAYFKVKKGSKFSVKTANGDVTVLGTQFNVTSQDELFQVVCYEGKVSVSSRKHTEILTRGEAFRRIEAEQEQWNENVEAPSWINNTSSFHSVPISYVLQEIEEQYNLKIKNKPLDNTIIYTGTFPNDNLDVALKTVFSTLDVTYTLSEDKRTLVLK